jgi:hypothetical protein
MSRVLENFPTVALRDFYLSREFELVHSVYKTNEIQDLVDRIGGLAEESVAVAILEGTGTYSYFWKEQLQKKGIFVLVADQGMVKSSRRSLGGTDNKDDEFDALVMCELYRRHYLEIYDRRFWVKELNPKLQDIRRTLPGRQNNHPQANQFHQYYQGTAGVGIPSARLS